MSQISKRVVLLTGAASGIGRATAMELARRGARLLVVDLNPDGLESLKAELPGPGEIIGEVVADLGTRAGVDAVIEAGKAVEGGVDILINNAGICVVAPVEQTTPDDIDKLIAVNLRAVMGVTQGLLPAMLGRGGAHIVNIASISGLAGVPGFVAYGTTKFAVVGYSEGLRNELSARGIRVTTVCPGVINTPLKQNLTLRGFDGAIREKIRGYPPEKVASQIAKAILGDKSLISPAGNTLRMVQRLAPGLTRLVFKKLNRRMLAPVRK